MKTIKVILSIGLIFILAFINFAYAEKTNLKDEELFIKAFEATEADFSTLNINYNGTILELYKDEEQLNSMMEYIIKELGLTKIEINPVNENGEYFNTHTEAFDSSQLVMYGKDKYDNSITVILYSYFDKEKNSGETSIVTDIIQNRDYMVTGEIIRKVGYLYRTYDIKAEITYCIIGAFDAKLNEDNMIIKIMKVLSMTEGKRIEGLIEDDLISISAYSPDLDRTIYTGNKKMNLNIALSYNEYEGKTYIIMGYPIIAIGY